MKKKDKIFTEIYKINESTNLCIIEIGIDQYADIFNKWDSAPFKRREVNPELEQYLERCSDEIPFRYPIELHFTFPEGIKDTQKEDKSRDGIKNHFTFRIYIVKRKLNRNNRRTLYCALAGSFFLGIVAIWKFTPERVLPSIIEQGLLIGGWVFLWEAVSLLFFVNYELYHSYRTYKRLRNAPIIFRELSY
ncbi:conserved hypothetical protein [Gloeothece citriformis PCC 7424]|uniref:Uncharacterized protein n=1 Tax=Gloeothece citriformis (strain PCC 7424) TaxID=65393 RepID=B7KD37_GLOC7|nr:hypothetical protein [Gloeothece citriformis]ACK73158.1 conserved hypothetical protein [Gloeothece citriformis PCC 7424]